MALLSQGLSPSAAAAAAIRTTGAIASFLRDGADGPLMQAATASNALRRVRTPLTTVLSELRLVASFHF